MNTNLQQFTAEHRYLLDLAAQKAGFTQPVAIALNHFADPLLKAARKGELVPVDGVLIRDWAQACYRLHTGFQIGMRVYTVQGLRFVQIQAHYSEQVSYPAFNFTVVDRKDYLPLYRLANKLFDQTQPPSVAPVLPPEQYEVLAKNTIGYLETGNLERIKAYGGRARRGILLTGAPGNGKTMACRWIWEQCRRRRWEWRLVTPEAYRQARCSGNAVEAVRGLFTVQRRGVVFFDDMDIALRDRETVGESEDQAVFLSAMDGITVNEGVVFLFTTNCSLDLIDRAFKRPGRLDVLLHFKAPEPPLRRELMLRWHADIQGGIDLDRAVATTEGYSFAEIEELKNLLVMNFIDSGGWDWDWALQQFDINRSELSKRHRRLVGFGQALAASGNGNGTDGEAE
jgi:hypothetical protein